MHLGAKCVEFHSNNIGKNKDSRANAKSLQFVNLFFATTQFCELRIPSWIIFIILQRKMKFEHFRPCRNSLHSCRKSCHHFAQNRPVDRKVDVEHILCLWGSKLEFWAKSALLGALGATCAQPVFSSRSIDGFGVLHLHFFVILRKKSWKRIP